MHRQHPSCSPTSTLRVDNSLVSTGCEDCICTVEWLGAGTDRQEVLRRGQTLVSLEVAEEVKQVTTECRDLALGDEAVYGRIAVGPAVQLEGVAVEGRRGNGRSCRGDGASTSDGGKPDHDFVLVRAGRRGRGEHVVGHIGNNR